MPIPKKPKRTEPDDAEQGYAPAGGITIDSGSGFDEPVVDKPEEARVTAEGVVRPPVPARLVGVKPRDLSMAYAVHGATLGELLHGDCLSKSKDGVTGCIDGYFWRPEDMDEPRICMTCHGKTYMTQVDYLRHVRWLECRASFVPKRVWSRFAERGEYLTEDD